jgi:CheY-like chemotaxis protein
MANTPVPGKPLQGARKSKKIVLVVDDDALVRNLLVAVVEASGCAALEASNGLDAMKTFKRSDSVISLLITDFLMPGMDGRELIERLTSKQPNLKAILVSGLPEVDSGTVPGVRLVRKPCGMNELKNAIEDVIGRSDE